MTVAEFKKKFHLEKWTDERVNRLLEALDDLYIYFTFDQADCILYSYFANADDIYNDKCGKNVDK